MPSPVAPGPPARAPRRRYQALDAAAERKHRAGKAPAPVDQRAPARDVALVCTSCGNLVTRTSSRMKMLDSHEHRFMNPAGILFHIGCFAQAIGCVIIGPASLEYAWFPGYAWRLALCGECGDHLGWHFRATSGAAFFGLRLDRLREEVEGPPRDAT